MTRSMATSHTPAKKPAPRRHRRSRLAWPIVVVTLALAGVALAAPESRRELVVLEAASLKDVFAKLSQRFETENAGAKVIASAAGSQELRAQIEHGAAADVFASADRKHMDALAAQGLVQPPAIFACNEPIVVVRAGLPSIKTFGDLPRAEKIIIGAPEVPIGNYTLQILRNASAGKLGADFEKRVQDRVVSRELNVRQVLAKVVLGEADAGIVYRSDAMAAREKVRVVEIPPDVNVTAEYPIAVLKAAPHSDLAKRFVELVRSPAGATALREAGFVQCAVR